MKVQREKILFLALFTLVGYIFLQIPFTKLAGSNISFTLFDFFGPIAGVFLGPLFGIVSVLTVQIANILIHQTPITTGVIIRLFPTLFAVYYFAVFSRKQSKNQRNERLILAVPIIAMILFIVHPIGRSVWYYSLFWLIPLAAYFKRDVLFFRSLGSTFTAHAVGGAAWIWAFNLPASVWQSLIPVVIQERLVFAIGISVSYIVVKHVLSFLIAKKLLPRLESIKLSV